MQTQKFDKAKALFEKVIESGISELADRAKVHISICNQQLERIQNTFNTPEEHYDFAVSLMNLGDFVTAREHLEAFPPSAPLSISSGTAWPCWSVSPDAPRRVCSTWPRPSGSIPELVSRPAMTRTFVTWPTIRASPSCSILKAPSEHELGGLHAAVSNP